MENVYVSRPHIKRVGLLNHIPQSNGQEIISDAVQLGITLQYIYRNLLMIVYVIENQISKFANI